MRLETEGGETKEVRHVASEVTHSLLSHASVRLFLRRLHVTQDPTSKFYLQIDQKYTLNAFIKSFLANSVTVFFSNGQRLVTSTLFRIHQSRGVFIIQHYMTFATGNALLKLSCIS
jgi:hypothetical protein